MGKTSPHKFAEVVSEIRDVQMQQPRALLIRLHFFYSSQTPAIVQVHFIILLSISRSRFLFNNKYEHLIQGAMPNLTDNRKEMEREEKRSRPRLNNNYRDNAGGKAAAEMSV